jgi:hypothetical protein
MKLEDAVDTVKGRYPGAMLWAGHHGKYYVATSRGRIIGEVQGYGTRRQRWEKAWMSAARALSASKRA